MEDGRSGAPLRSDKQSLRKRQPCLCSLSLSNYLFGYFHFFSLEKIYQFHEQVSRGAISLRFRSHRGRFFPPLPSRTIEQRCFGEERERVCSSQNYATLWDVILRVYSFSFFRHGKKECWRKSIGYVTGGGKIGLEDWKTRSEGGRKSLVSEGARFAREKCSRRK